MLLQKIYPNKHTSPKDKHLTSTQTKPKASWYKTVLIEEMMLFSDKQ